MQTKSLRRVCGRLKEEGLISVHSRGEKKEGAPTISTQPGSFKDRVFYRDWYYINYHRALDCIKYKLWRLNRYIESLGAPTTEKKDLVCPRCKSEYTELEAMDSLSPGGDFLCHMCSHKLNHVEETDTSGQNEAMKRMNQQLGQIVTLMKRIDSSTVPENGFDDALAYAKPISRGEYAPARQMIHVEEKAGLESTRGLNIVPDTIIANVLGDSDVIKVDPNEVLRRKEAEGKANALPSWITHSSVSGDITRVGAKEQAEKAARDVHTGLLESDTGGEDKKTLEDDSAVLNDYFELLKADQEQKRLEREAEDEEEEEEDEDDDFEDVVITGGGNNGANQVATSAATPNTSGAVSSTATDDEDAARGAKRVRFEASQSNGNGNGASSSAAKVDDAKDAVSDEDELEFEDV